MAKSRPFSMRLGEELHDYVVREARRTRRSKGAVVESLAEEAARCRRFPGIAFRGPEPRRAWLLGTALDVWQVVEAYRDFGSVERMARESDLDERQIGLALAYYEQHNEEIDDAISENRRPLEELVRELPGARVIRTGV